MTLTKKIIEFNPAFLGAGGSSKTKKNRAPKVAPLISPNVLRNRLLKRIKEHKKKEFGQEASVNSAFALSKNKEETKNNQNEFDDSFSFLEELTKKKEQILSNNNVLSKSIKHRPLFRHPTQTNIQVDLPDELKPETPTTSTVAPLSELSVFSPPSSTYVGNGDNVPYGILKGGKKPTFRDWNKTRKNLEPTTITTQAAGTIIPPKNLHIQKLKDLQLKLNAKLPQKLETSSSSAEPSIIPAVTTGGKLNKPSHAAAHSGKKLLKRTIRRKYTLGKSKLKKSVSILLKNQETRKNILTAHRALKSVPLSDVNVYLKKQNLIKIGSAAPADVVRQIYESALMTGQVTNVNKDTLLHNFIKGESDILF